jgi:ubiquitin-conjugating enzyme (huntingtin interacting protein 2)
MATKRVMCEFKEIDTYIKTEMIDNHRFLNISLIDNNIFKMNVVFLGPKISPYEEIINTITIDLPKEYPIVPPIMKFQNKIYHPNISKEGVICLDVLKDQWRPVYTLRTILMSIISLLSDPNPDSALNCDAAKNYIKSKESLKEQKIYYNLITDYEKICN